MKFICNCCNKEYDDEEVEKIVTKEGEVICETCAEDSGEYNFCEWCDEYTKEDLIPIRDYRGRISRYVCPDCADNDFHHCEDCGDWFGDDTGFYTTHNGEEICEDCYEDHYHTCDECGRVFYEDDGEYDEDDNDYWYCNECSRKNRKIQKYGYKPDPIFKSVSLHDRFIVSSDVKEPFFGVELEIDKGTHRMDCASEILDASEDVYCKEDGSLRDNGIEIVSHPCTINYHLTELGWDKIVRIALSHEYKSHDARTCGLHVHVGRYQLGNTEDERHYTIAKIILAVNRHWNNLVTFSRRQAGQLDSWAKKPTIKFNEDKNKLIDKALRTRNNGRYQAVNLQNYATIEFRIFNGTLKIETLFATLQLVSNLVNFCKDNDHKTVNESKWNDIQHYKNYDELNNYCIARGIAVEEVNIVPNATAELKVGDKVRIVDNFEFGNQLNGLVGTIASITECGGENFLVSFAENMDEVTRRNANSRLHNGGGELCAETGRWFYENHLEVIA